MQLRFFQTLYGHMEWADALLWRTILAEPSVNRDDYIIDSVVHLHMVQQAYLAVWHGEPVATPGRDHFGGLVEIRDWARSFHPRAAAFLEGLTDERVAEVFPIPWTELIEKEIGGPASPARLGDMVYQVAAHSAHHRAQINRRIREVGGAPSMVDFIGWIWRGTPAADWSGDRTQHAEPSSTPDGGDDPEP